MMGVVVECRTVCQVEDGKRCLFNLALGVEPGEQASQGQVSRQLITTKGRSK